ncbi:CAPSL [Symbiodinium microadriaticum]|nr:CAPSL [Symbiodinium microadriaticum]
MSALYEVGTVTDVPVIPGIICQSSLLEAKGVLPNLAEEWSCAMLDMLDLANIEDGEFGAVHAPEAAPFAPPTPEEADYATLLEKFRETLKARGASGIFGLQRKFRIMDDDNSKSISMAEFSKAVKEHTLECTPAQVKILFDHFDSDQSGGISFDEFIFGVRGVLNERRQQLVMMAFEILDTDKSGVIEVDDVKAKYDTSKHPDVISGKRTSDDVLSEFLETFEGTENDAKDGKVTPAEFMRYYANLSSSIDEDDYFELMIRNAWHISGGEGWCENSTCRRVLVVHQDGRQTVEEISNDLGMDKDDKDAMIARLVEQGIDDIASIDLSGSCDTPSTPAAAEAPAAVVQARTGRRAQGGKATIVLG